LHKKRRGRGWGDFWGLRRFQRKVINIIVTFNIMSFENKAAGIIQEFNIR
jgi:hypothetical protein